MLTNRTTVLVIIASVAVGIAMFGGTTFLGQYFQLARGYSPTHAGLLTIPLMVALLISSTLVWSDGHPDRAGGSASSSVGGILLAAGLGLLGTIDHTTPIWHVGISMALMGLGLGAMMQNLVLAVQNTVDVRDIGATSATRVLPLPGRRGRRLGAGRHPGQPGARPRSPPGLTRSAPHASGGGSAGGDLDLKDLPAPSWRSSGPRTATRPAISS